MFELPGETVFTLVAIEPTTGATITGVAVSNIVIYGKTLAAGDLSERLIPMLSAEEVEDLGG